MHSLFSFSLPQEMTAREAAAAAMRTAEEAIRRAERAEQLSGEAVAQADRARREAEAAAANAEAEVEALTAALYEQTQAATEAAQLRISAAEAEAEAARRAMESLAAAEEAEAMAAERMALAQRTAAEADAAIEASRLKAEAAIAAAEASIAAVEANAAARVQKAAETAAAAGASAPGAAAGDASDAAAAKPKNSREVIAAALAALRRDAQQAKDAGDDKEQKYLEEAQEAFLAAAVQLNGSIELAPEDKKALEAAKARRGAQGPGATREARRMSQVGDMLRRLDSSVLQAALGRLRGAPPKPGAASPASPAAAAGATAAPGSSLEPVPEDTELLLQLSPAKRRQALGLPAEVRVRFHVQYKTVWGEEIRVIGAHPAMGEWDISRAVKMTQYDHQTQTWSGTLALVPGNVYEYKYILVKSRTGELIQWQPGADSLLPIYEDDDDVEVRDSWAGASPDVAIYSKAGGSWEGRHERLIALLHRLATAGAEGGDPEQELTA